MTGFATIAGVQSQRWAWTHTYAVPMFVTSVIAVLLAGAGLVALLVFDRTGDQDSGAPPAAPGTSPEPSPEPGREPSPEPEVGAEVDECLVGTWDVVSHTEEFPVLRADPEQLRQVGEGSTVEFRADGTGTTDFGQTRLEGETVTVERTGRVTFRYQATGGTYRVLESDPGDATVTVTVAGIPIGTQPATLSRAPLEYRCEGDTMTIFDEDRGAATEYQR